MKREPKIMGEAHVRCSGKLHQIVVTERGEIVLCGHRGSDGAAEAAAHALAGTSCRCFEIRAAVIAAVRLAHKRLRLGGLSDIPEGLRTAVKRLHARLWPGLPRGRGWKRPRARARDVRARWDRRVQGRVKGELLRAMPYKQGSSRWVDCDTSREITVDPDVSPHVTGTSEKVWHPKKPWAAQKLVVTYATTPRDGRDAYIACGCAMRVPRGDDLYPVVKLEQDARGRWLATTGRQGRGLSVEPARAIVDLGEPGSPAKGGEPCRFVRWVTR